MGFLLIDARFDLPALMIAVDELEGRSLLWVEQGRHQAMQLTGIGVVARLRSRELGQSLGGVRLDAIRDHTHLHIWQPLCWLFGTSVPKNRRLVPKYREWASP